MGGGFGDGSRFVLLLKGEEIICNIEIFCIFIVNSVFHT